MGVRGVPDLAQIIDRAQIPVKVSCVVNDDNRHELPDFLERCQAIGIQRLVVRQLYGDTQALPVAADLAHVEWNTAQLKHELTRAENIAAIPSTIIGAWKSRIGISINVTANRSTSSVTGRLASHTSWRRPD